MVWPSHSLKCATAARSSTSKLLRANALRWTPWPVWSRASARHKTSPWAVALQAATTRMLRAVTIDSVATAVARRQHAVPASKAVLKPRVSKAIALTTGVVTVAVLSNNAQKDASKTAAHRVRTTVLNSSVPKVASTTTVVATAAQPGAVVLVIVRPPPVQPVPSLRASPVSAVVTTLPIRVRQPVTVSATVATPSAQRCAAVSLHPAAPKAVAQGALWRAAIHAEFLVGLT